MDFSLTSHQLELQARAREAAEELVAPFARESDESGTFNRGVIHSLASRGFLGLTLPQKYGGVEVDNVAMSLVYEEFGRVDSSVRGFLTVHCALISQCLLESGTEDQRERWLPSLARGEMYGCYCLTESEAGSDPAAMTTTASRDGDSWVMNGEKRWITNGNVADLAIVFATVDSSLRARGVTAFLVPTSTHGFVREPMQGRELGHRGSDHARIRLQNVRVGPEALLGEVGTGFKLAMRALDHGRLGVAAGALGVLQACLDCCVTFAQNRRQFGKRIGDFEMIQAVLADMAADTEAARLLVRHAAWQADTGTRNTHAVSVAKLFATESAARATAQSVLLHGSRGYSNEYPVERFYRDITGLQIYEGTSHIQRIIIARNLVGRDEARSG